MEVTEELKGTISNAYMVSALAIAVFIVHRCVQDPLSEYSTDFSPELSFAKTTGWKKSE